MPDINEEFEAIDTDWLNSIVPKSRINQQVQSDESSKPRPDTPVYLLNLNPPSQQAIELAVDNLCKKHRKVSERPAISSCLLLCFKTYCQEISRLGNGLHPSDLSTYGNALKRVVKTSAELANAIPGRKRAAQKRLDTARRSAGVAAAALPDKAARAINDVRLKLYSASDGISSELSSISYLLSFLETESPRGHQEAPRHKLQRELALIAWGINPAKWRQLVSECMNEANVQCIDPQEQPGRFDQQLGVDWIKKHLSSY